MQNWIDCIRTRKKPVSDVEIAHRSVGVCHLANITRWVGRRLKWDPVAERFQDDDEANRYVESQDMLTPFFVSTPRCSSELLNVPRGKRRNMNPTSCGR